jgi:RND superfamily putative drug exporter
MRKTAILAAKLGAWGHWVVTHHRAVLVVWLLILFATGWTARDLVPRLQGGSGQITGSGSAAVENRLAEGFDSPYAQSLVWVIRSPTATIDTPRFRKCIQDLASVMRETPHVRAIMGSDDPGGERLRADDGRGSLLLVGLGPVPTKTAEQMVPILRMRAATLRAEWLTQNPGAELWLTGRGALTADLNRFNTEDSTRAEMRSLPLTALVLVLAFGSVVAAGLPVGCGALAVVAASAVMVPVTRWMELSTLAQTVAAMLGLALGIDYALLIVQRFREALADGDTVSDAVARTLSTAGVAVLISGLTVAIGLLGLAVTPMLDTRSMGIGGMCVTLTSLLVSLTLLPALLALFGTRLNGARGQAHRRAQSLTGHFERIITRVVSKPAVAVVGASIIAGLLVAPVFTLKPGFPDRQWLPETMEYRRGFEAMQKMGKGSLVAPIDVLLTAPDAALAPKHLPALLAFGKRLRNDPRVAAVIGPLEFGNAVPRAQMVMFLANPEAALQRFPELAAHFVSRDCHTLYWQILLRDSTSFEEAKTFTREWEKLPPPGVTIAVGGQAAFYRDYDDFTPQTVKLTLCIVLIGTLVSLSIIFRSFLIPLKAILLNSLSVLTGLGAVVLVFQHGIGGTLVGLDAPLGSTPVPIILSLFCLMFGLSMDYEIFIITRIKEHYDAGSSNRNATIQGLSTTAGVVTSAGAIMLCVFGAFTFAEYAAIQMLGLGLAVAIAVDAILIRLMLLPATMVLLGDWNWYPGVRPTKDA